MIFGTNIKGFHGNDCAIRHKDPIGMVMTVLYYPRVSNINIIYVLAPHF